MKQFRHSLFSVVMAFTLWVPSMVAAEEPLDLYPGPLGSLGLVTYYTHVTGNELYTDGSKRSDDFNVAADIGVFRGVYYGMFWNIRTCTNIIVPFGSSSVDTTAPASGVPFDVHMASPTGLGDIILNSGAYLFYDEKTLLCLPVSFYITAPTGEYDKDKTLNMSSNRWAFKPSIGLARGIGSKGTIVEALAQAEFYTKNDKYGAAGAEQKKDALFTFQLMLTQFLDPQTFISADYFYESGGGTELDSVRQDDKTETQALQFAMARMITSTTQVMFRYRSDFKVENGSRNETFQVRIAYLVPDFGNKSAAE